VALYGLRRSGERSTTTISHLRGAQNVQRIIPTLISVNNIQFNGMAYDPA
jgi:hypothetical protein